MPNTIFINVNKVENVVTKKIYHEIEVWDDYNSASISITKEDIPKTDLDALQYCIDYGSDDCLGLSDVIDAILEYRSCVTINGTFYDWNEIKQLFGLEED